MTLLVGIDLGSQSAKVVVHDGSGTVVASGRRALRPPDTPAPGVVEHPDDDLWDAVGEAARAAVADLVTRGGDPAGITGVGLCGIRFCRALLRADGTLAQPVLSWMDARVSRPHDASQVAPDVAWVTASSGYLAHRLTGRFVDSAAAYQGMWPIDSARGDWFVDDEALAAYGVPRAQLVDLVQPGEVLGEVTAAAAAHTGLPAGVPVVATANDKAVEALGCGLTAPEDVLLSLGTYVAAMTVGDAPRADAVSSWTNVAAVPGRWLHESTGVRRGMWTVSWLRDLVGGTEEELGEGAAAVPAGSAGLLTVLDWLAPPEEPHRRGAFVGLDVRHGRHHLYRSVLEGLVMTMHAHTDAMAAELGSPVRRVVVSGGGGRSPLVRQVVADVFDRPAVTVRAESAAALGAAVCAAVGCGVHPSFDAAVAAMVHEDTVTEPDPAGHATYAAVERVHRTLAGRLDPALRDLHDLGL